MERAAAGRAQTQADTQAYRQQAAPAPAPSGGGDDMLAQLDRLGQLHASGVLDDAEFAAAKAKLLA